MAPVDIGTLTGHIEVIDNSKPAFAALDANVTAAGSKLGTLTTHSTNVQTSLTALGSTASATSSTLAGAAAPVGTLTARLDAVQASGDRVRASLAGLGGTAGPAGAAIASITPPVTTLAAKFEALVPTIAKLGAAMSVGITAPLFEIASAAIEAGVPFIRTMNTLQAVTGASAEDFKRLQAAAIEWGIKTVYSSAQAADALLVLAKAGFDTNQSIAALPPTLQLAAAGGLSLKDAATMTAVTMKTFGLSTEDLGRSNDILAKAANSSLLSLQDLQQAFKFVGPVAHSAGLSLADVTAAMTVMADAGIKGDIAGTSLRNAIERLEVPTKKQAEVMRELGLQNVYVNGTLMPLPEILTRIQQSGADASKIMELFGLRAGPAMVVLAEKGGSALREMTDRLNDSTGAAARMADAAMKGLPGALENMRGSIETANIALLQVLEPALVAGANAIKGLADFVSATLIPAFKSLDPAIQNGTIGLVAIAGLAGPASLALIGVVYAVESLSAAYKVASGWAVIFQESLSTTWIGALGPAMALLAQGAVAVGVGMASWKMGDWIGQLDLFSGKIQTLTGKVEYYAAQVFRAATLQKAVNAEDLASVVALDEASRAASKHGAAIETVATASKNAALAFDLLVGPVKAMSARSEEADAKAKSFAKSLGTLQEKLSGTDLLEKATQYETVLRKIGGASSLTSKETDAVILAYTAVIEKYQQLGPAGESTVTKFQALLAPLTAKVADFSTTLTAARAELAGLSEAKLDDLTTAIQSGAFTMKQLEASTGLSETALKLFKQQITESGKATRDSTSIFDDYNKKVGQLGIALGEALKSDAPIEFVKDRFKSMITSVVADAAILGRTLPPLISDAFLAITIKEGADHLLKEFAKFGEDMNKQMKADLDRINKAIIQTLDVTIKAQNGTADATAKFQNQALANEIRNLEAIAGVTRQSLDMRRQLYVQEYQQELALLQRKADAEKLTLTSTGQIYSDALTAIDQETAAKMQLAAQTYIQKLNEMDTATKFWSKKTLDSLAGAFNQLASVTGSAAGSIIGDVAAILTAMQTAMKAGEAFADGNYFQAAVQGYTAIEQATASPSTSHNIAGGAATGAELGFMIAGPYGALVGGVAGAIYGWLKSAKNTAFMKEVGRDWAVTITKEMADTIKKDSQTLFGGNRQAAEIFDMSKIMGTAGGLNSGNLDQFTAKLHDVFSMYQTGAFTAAQAVKVLDDNWQAFAAAGTDADGRLSTGLKEVVRLTVETGLKSKEIAAWMKGQGTTALTGFANVVAGAALTTKQNLTDMGLQAVASINAAVKAGISLPEALRAVAPALQTIMEGYKTLGLDIDNAALKALIFQSAVMTGNPALIAGIDGLSASMIALDNLGALNTDTFAAMERTGFDMYTRLQGEVAKLGGGTKDALGPMQKYLHDAEAEAKLLGIPLDENTAQMIAQSKELGIWKDRGATPTEKLTEGMQGVVTSLDKMIERMDIIIGKQIPDKSFDVTERHRIVNEGDPNAPPPVQGIPRGSAATASFAGTAGRVMDVGPRGTLLSLQSRGQTQAPGPRAGSNVIDIAPMLAEQRRLNDFLMTRFGPSLARATRDENQKAARR